MSQTPDIVERLHTVVEDDHERGCQMRFCVCSCGFDDNAAKAAKDAIYAITDQQATIARLARELGAARDAEAAEIADWMSTGQCHIIIDTQLASVDDYPSDIASAIARTIARHEHRKD